MSGLNEKQAAQESRNIVRNIVMIRNELGLSQEELANKADIPLELLEDIENEDVLPTLSCCLKILSVMEYTLEIAKSSII